MVEITASRLGKTRAVINIANTESVTGTEPIGNAIGDNVQSIAENRLIKIIRLIFKFIHSFRLNYIKREYDCQSYFTGGVFVDKNNFKYNRNALCVMQLTFGTKLQRNARSI